MNQERLYKVVLGPVVSEKSSVTGDGTNQMVFKVAKDATKIEIKTAIEKLFEIKVENVRVLNVKGKTRRTRHGMGKRSDWKKAYVRLEQDKVIDFETIE